MILDWRHRLHGRMYRDEDGGGDGGDGGGDGGDGGGGGGIGFGGSGTVGGDTTASNVGSIGAIGAPSSGMAGDVGSIGAGYSGGLSTLGGSDAGYTGSTAQSIAPPTFMQNLTTDVTMAAQQPSTWAKALLGLVTGGPIGAGLAFGSSALNQQAAGIGTGLQGVLSGLEGNPLGLLAGVGTGLLQATNAGELQDGALSGSLDASGGLGGQGSQGYSTNGFTDSAVAASTTGTDAGLAGLLAGLSGTSSNAAGSDLSNPAVSALSQYNQTDQGTTNLKNSVTSIGFGSNTASPGFGNPPSLGGLYAQQGSQNG